MMHRLSHAGANFCADNKTMFSQLVTATLGTLYASTMASFKRLKDGRGALAALKAQFAGAAHWEKEVKVHDAVLRERVFNGRSGTTIHKFVAAHCTDFHGLHRCSDHVICTIPDGRERVTFLEDGMEECNDAEVKAALANICLNDSPTGMRNDFKKAVTHLLPTYPVKGKNKRGNADISAAGAAVVGSTTGRGGGRGGGGGRGDGGGCGRGG
jgi:hypothetical protein